MAIKFKKIDFQLFLLNIKYLLYFKLILFIINIISLIKLYEQL